MSSARGRRQFSLIFASFFGAAMIAGAFAYSNWRFSEYKFIDFSKLIFYTKKDILEMLKSAKTYKHGALNNSDIDRRMRLKPNNPAFYSVKIELDDNFNIVLQYNNDDEFPKYTAILLLEKTNICRLDYHDGHRRKCKKEIFLDEPGIVYYVGQDRKKLNIFAPQGKVNQQKDEAELWPQVTAFYEDISLRANRARYKGKLKKIFLDGPVEARKGFDASQGGNASTSLSNHSMVLKAKNAVIDLETETIEAVGGVNAILGRTLP